MTAIWTCSRCRARTMFAVIDFDEVDFRHGGDWYTYTGTDVTAIVARFLRDAHA